MCWALIVSLLPKLLAVFYKMLRKPKMSQISNVFERAEFISAGGKEHVCISSLPSTIRPPCGWMGPSAAWKRSQNLLYRVFVMSQRWYQGFPGNWNGCVNFILRKDRVCSFGNNSSFADFINALPRPVGDIFWRWFLDLKAWGTDGQRWDKQALPIC